MVEQLSVAGASFAHPDVDAAERAPLSLEEPQLRGALDEITRHGINAMILSTCLRVEVVTTGCERALERVLGIIYPGRSLPEPAIRRNQEVLEHLTRVTAGLESPVLGEEEVLGQMRAAISLGRETGSVGGAFQRILEAAVAEARAARKLLPPSAAGSMAIVAADLADGAERAAVLGAGKMARAAVETLRSEGTEVTVYARRPDAVGFEVDRVRPMAEAPEALAGEQIVISATSSKRELFGPQVLEAALRGRSEPLTLIDLAMPPDFQPGPGLAGLRYLNLDDLAVHARRVHAPETVEEQIATGAAERWARLANNHEVGPVISAMLDEARRAVEEEVGRFSGKLGADEEQEKILTQLANTVAHRVLHRPLSFLSSGDNGAKAASVFAEAFGSVDAG